VASFYNICDRKTNIIHNKLRHRCSGLNADLYRVNLKNDPCCVCGHLFEDAINFFLECPLYQHDRTSLFNYFNNIVPISIEYILFGCNVISEELNTYCSNQCKNLFDKLVDLIIIIPNRDIISTQFISFIPPPFFLLNIKTIFNMYA
jgi:hypothetical protein